METPPPNLSEWDTREYEELLTRETPEWREKRRIAEDPNTTADELSHLEEATEAFIESHTEVIVAKANVPKIHLLLHALAAHPNIRPETLQKVLEFVALPEAVEDGFALIAPAVCRNPLTPLLMLETPDFWLDADCEACQSLLARGDLPPPVAAALTRYEAHEIAPTARLHVSQADFPRTPLDGARELTQFWRAFCQRESGFIITAKMQQEHVKMVQWGYAPAWAAGKTPVTVPANRLHAVRGIMTRLMARRLSETSYSRLVHFAFRLQMPLDGLSDVYKWGVSHNWTWRLAAALRLPLADTPFLKDPCSRSPRLLLQHLAGDGNRFVRWAAQTRLVDPEYVFKWQD